jgi:hypothetical protein
MEMGAIIAGIGVDSMFMSFVHCVEDTLKSKFPLKTRLDEIFISTVKDIDGNIVKVKTLAAHPMIHNNDIRTFVKKHLSTQACKDLNCKGNRFFRADAKLLYHEMTVLAEKGITIYTKKW